MTAALALLRTLPDPLRGRGGLALLGLSALLLMLAGLSILLPQPAPQGEAPLPAPAVRQAVQATSATALRPVAPQDAQTLNAAIPIADLPNPPARPFGLASLAAADRSRSVDCLAAAIYYEAATEPLEGQRAVAQVVLNRLRHPAYPNTVCGVVFEGAQRTTGCQFSFTCDGSLRRAPMAGLWERARRIANEALNGYVHAPVGWATHYHANYVLPYWASSLTKSATIGAHIFYRWQGGWGRPGAFRDAYRGAEPAIAWRGGFGQPLRSEQQALATGDKGEAVSAEQRDALARQAAADAAVERAIGDPNAPAATSFNRAVLRRYEPIERVRANAMIDERVRRDSGVTTSQRWALTGQGDAAAPAQEPLGRRTEPANETAAQAR